MPQRLSVSLTIKVLHTIAPGWSDSGEWLGAPVGPADPAAVIAQVAADAAKAAEADAAAASEAAKAAAAAEALETARLQEKALNQVGFASEITGMGG